MILERIGGDFSICQLPDTNFEHAEQEYFFLGKTDEEISLVCREENVPVNALQRDDGWNMFRIKGVLDFSLIGILSQITFLLAQAGICIFAVSTFNTDYILTKKENMEKALQVLKNAGHEIL